MRNSVPEAWGRYTSLKTPKEENIYNLMVKVLDIASLEEVKEVVTDILSAGNYTYEWDASSLASGVYLYRLEAGEFVETRKMILMR